jgi:5-methylcytosine-specific restriction endonuclease McrA
MNLVAACRACNSEKADRLPEEAGMKLVYLPYVPSLLGPS